MSVDILVSFVGCDAAVWLLVGLFDSSPTLHHLYHIRLDLLLTDAIITLSAFAM